MDSAKTLEFISLIQERPELWHKENRDFMNREIRARIFSEVADMIGISGEVCKKKLKCLKDKMRDIVSKLPRSNRGQPDLDTAEQHVRWPFFKPMLFMVDEFPGSGNSKDTSSNGIFNHDLQAVKEETLSSVEQHESDGESMLSLPLDRPEQGAGPTITTAMRAPAGVSGAQSQSRLMHEPPAKRTRNGTGETFLSFEGLHQLKTLFSSSQEEKRQSLPQPQDECQTFCDAIAFDLRKLEDPLLMMRVKRETFIRS